MHGLYGCCMHTGLAHHVLARRVYTEVALSQSFMIFDSPHRCDHWRGPSM